MQELEVSVGRQTYPLQPPFFVVATQNPVEQEGTYPLPEAQLDRFMFNIPVSYPSPDEECEIVKTTTSNVDAQLHPILRANEVLELQTLVRGVPVANDVVSYAVALTGFSRPETVSQKHEDVHRFIRYGASPRASQYLILGAKARAVLLGRLHVDFEDVVAMASPVMRHRLVLNFHARAEGVDTDEIIRRILKKVRPR
jgi:MoxR-like ATPase